MELCLMCNHLKCHKELTGRALIVVTCSHIFCPECAQLMEMAAQQHERHTMICLACNYELDGSSETFGTDVNPSEEFKTIILCGLSPSAIMECARRALDFWTYQTAHDVTYQKHVNTVLKEKYSKIHLDLENEVRRRTGEVKALHRKLKRTEEEREVLARKKQEMLQAYREQSRKLLQSQEMYDKAKRKAEMGHVQQAASDAVDLTLSLASHTNQGFGQNHIVDVTNMNTALPRAQNTVSRDDGWPRTGNNIQATGNSSLLGRPGGLQRLAGAGVPSSGVARHAPVTNAPKFANNRVGLAGVGFTSGLRVNQPSNNPGLDKRSQ